MNNKVLIKSEDIYYAWDELGGWLELENISTEEDFISYGMDTDLLSLIPEEAWSQLASPSIVYYTDDPDKTQVLIETETEPFTIYDEMGDSMEVLYYTDDPDKNDAELEIVANYSPLDELGDFEIVTWTDRNENNLQLKMIALPLPQFIYQSTPAQIYGHLLNLDFTETEDEIDSRKYRVLLSSDKKQWKTWDGNNFINIDVDNKIEIYKSGMTLETVRSIEEQDWEKWTDENIYIGVYINENSGGNGSYVESFRVIDLAPTETTKVEDAKLYILNTKSTINVSLEGSTLSGTIDDEDLTKVQYRVLLNGEPFYPTDGSFTELQPPPLNIAIKLTNKDYLIDENNILRVEFHDYWGSTDYWETQFIGKYYGLMFLDESGDYYSTEIGEVLKYLDFGVVIAGQTTLEQKIVLRNTYGYPVKNIKIRTNQDSFPKGMKAQLGKSEIAFEALDELIFPDILEDGEEVEFYIRLATELGATPNTQGQFDIIVTADKV